MKKKDNNGSGGHGETPGDENKLIGERRAKLAELRRSSPSTA